MTSSAGDGAGAGAGSEQDLSTGLSHRSSAAQHGHARVVMDTATEGASAAVEHSAARAAVHADAVRC
eukprot:7179988-Prymnesium_polylepis.1